MPTLDLIENFTQFARAQVKERGEGIPIDELFDEWRILNPPSDDWQTIHASLRDLENGETGRPFEEFAAEFRQRNRVQENRSKHLGD